MKTISIVSSIELGPWRIPQKAQNLLISSVAEREKLKIDFVVSEFVFPTSLPLLTEAVRSAGGDCVVIFASVFQLPANSEVAQASLDSLKACTLHFALEDISIGPGKANKAFIEEVEHFRKCDYLNETQALTLLKNNASEEPVKELFQSTRLKSEEVQTLEKIYENFATFPIPLRQKLENFPNWVRHRDLARFLYKAEIYRSIVNVPGVVIEAGVLFGGSLATWLHLGEIFEPVNYGRRVFGLDTFTGFPEVTKQDMPLNAKYPELYKVGTYSAKDAEQHIFELFGLLDKTRKIPQIPRMRLIKGDVRKTLPALLAEDKSIIISLLYLDVDLYAPTKEAIDVCISRMPKGSVICIDELCYEDWPGETQAVIDCFKNLNSITIERSPFVPNIATIRIG